MKKDILKSENENKKERKKERMKESRERIWKIRKK